VKRPFHPIGRNRVAVQFIRGTQTQGSPHSIRPTLGWRAESRWDRRSWLLIGAAPPRDGIASFLTPPFPYANGVSPSSPGLRGPRYPGSGHPHTTTPTGLRPVRRPFHPIGRNRVAVQFIRGTRTQGRPHYIRPTLGWRAESRWDRRSWLLIGAAPPRDGIASFLTPPFPYANGVSPSSPGLRGPRYPGSGHPHTTTPTGLRPVRRPSHPIGRNRVAVQSEGGIHSQGRPHSIRPTLGWRAESRWDRRSWLLIGAAPPRDGIASFLTPPFPYANGVSPSSPGLRGPRYPGSGHPPTTTPTGLRPVRRPSHPIGRNRVAVQSEGGIHSQGRPHSIRPTLGWRAESRWDRRSWLLIGAAPPRRRPCTHCQYSSRNIRTLVWKMDVRWVIGS
jgi:hypothetical protein